MTALAARGTGTAAGAPFLSVQRLRKYFPIGRSWLPLRRREVRAVDDISFEVPSGQVVALVGESGSGKTTVGRLIVRMIDPTGGQVLFRGDDVARASGRRLKDLRKALQMVFQDPIGSLNPRLTVGRIIGEGLEIHGLYRGQAKRDRVADLLRKVGLAPEHAHRHPHEFSGGQRQRIGIARALAVEPELIVADEPVSALDVSIQAQVLNLLSDLKDELGLSLLVISHDLGVVHHMADYVIVLYLGRIMEMGPPDAIYRRPTHPYTESLLSAMPVPDPRTRDQRKRIILTGDIPSPINPPSGCVFRTRCPIAVADCARVVPPLDRVGAEPGHLKACIRR
jgi:oligopeptide/dipeptide ABC transporter ATP-binding protein